MVEGAEPMDASRPAGFWDFTLEVYARGRVQEAVIALQDRRGADVNLLFYCCYVAARGGGRLRREDLAQCDAIIADKAAGLRFNRPPESPPDGDLSFEGGTS